MPDGIDAILGRIEAEADRLRAADAADRPPEWSHETGRPRAAISVPSLTDPDDATPVETAKPGAHFSDFLALSDAAFLRRAYRLALGREPDRPGHDSLMAALASGAASRAQVLSGLMRSQEAGGRAGAVAGLTKRRTLDRAARLPLIGRLVAPFAAILTLRADMAALQRRLSAIDRRHGATVEGVNTVLSALRATLRGLDMTIRDVETDAATALAASHEAMGKGREAIETLTASRTMLAERSRQLQALIDDVRAGGQPPSPQIMAELEAHAHDELYVAFENRFRGSTDEIARRSERYLPLIRQLGPVAAGLPVLDVGCGRGEWLTRLAENGIAGRGVDLNRAMVEEARAAGHDVEAGDVIAALRAMEAGSLGAVTGFHIIEHLPFAVLVSLLDEAARVLAPGGAILFETPNPECIVVGAYSFYLDPTHRNPLPPEFVRFLAEARGYSGVRILRQREDLDLERPESGFSPREINDWFRAPMDYALFALRPDTDETGAE